MAVLFVFFSAIVITYLIIPVTIKIAKINGFIDQPVERSSHVEGTPSLGGIGIYLGFILSVCFWIPENELIELKYLLCTTLIIVLVGIIDDLLKIKPLEKLLGQFLATILVVYYLDIYLTNLHGFIGLNKLPLFLNYPISFFVILTIINGFNLIDGINGLASGVGLLVSLFFGIWFFLAAEVAYAIIALGLAGAIIAFLKYNYTPAKIFMGDTGSLLVGLVCAVLTIKFIELNATIPTKSIQFSASPIIAIAILIIPLSDTIRVFTLRLIGGRSPFSPDRNHIHHILLDAGFNHMNATGILLAFNGFIIGLSICLQNLSQHFVFGLIITMTIGFVLLIGKYRDRQQEQCLNNNAINQKAITSVQKAMLKN